LYYNISNAHTAAIYALAFDPSNPGFLVSGSAASTDKVKIWNINVYPPVSTKTLTGHSSAAIVTALAFESTGIMASGDGSSKLLIWNNNTDRTALFPTINTGNYVRALAFSPIMTDRLLVSGHSSSTGPYNIKTWNPSTGASINTLSPAHTANVLCLSFNAYGVLATGSADGSIKLWDTSRTNYRNLTITGTGLVRTVAFSSSDLLAAGSNAKVVVWY
jgi:WD40 repeat protein